MTNHRSLETALTRTPEELESHFRSLRTRADVAGLLEVTDLDLIYILYRRRHVDSYRRFQIPKKSGGTREIAAPHNSLKILQSKLNSVLAAAYDPKASVHGYLSGRSILTNALPHVKKRFVLNVDLANFFPSIHFGRVKGLFLAEPFQIGEEAATVLAQICCHRGTLPQGAPTSPTVSNMICARLDGQMRRLARRHRCEYTRYADDLTFSTNQPRFPPELAIHEDGWGADGLELGDELKAVIDSNTFEPNPSKIRLQYHSHHQEVTGIVVNESPNVHRRFVRQLRAMLHAWEVYGLEEAEREFWEKYDERRTRNPDHTAPAFSRVVKGKLDFLKMVKGEADPIYRRLANQLHDLDPDIVDHRPQPPGDADSRWAYWADYYKDLVFQLVVKHDGDELGGTAFAWKRHALATTAHDLAGRIQISPPCPGGHDFAPEDFSFHNIGRDDVDVATVRLPANASSAHKDFPIRERSVTLGEPVAALAYPAVPGHEPRLGFYLGAVESTMPYFGGQIDAIQVTIQVSGGMSGAPVIDRDGMLVGIVRGQPFAEEVEDGVPKRDFKDIVPVKYLLEIDV